MSRGYLLDTNVISEARKHRLDPGVASFFEAASADTLFVSVLSVGEIRRGAMAKRATDMVFAGLLDRWVMEIEALYQDRILPVTLAVAKVWAELNARRSLPGVDSLIAATALVHDLTLVTRNLRDMNGTGVELLNPWR